MNEYWSKRPLHFTFNLLYQYKKIWYKNNGLKSGIWLKSKLYLSDKYALINHLYPYNKLNGYF